jgi:glycosyltransferase involved in cell wall biosynthesis
MVSFFYSPEYSGSAIQAGNLCRYLARSGVESFVVSARLSTGRRSETVEGIEVFRIPVAKHPDLQIASFWLSLSLFLLRNRSAYDVIHAHGTLQHGPVGWMGRILGKPTFLKVAMANSDIAFHRQGRIWGRVNRFFVRRFDRFIATSGQIEQEFGERGIPPERVVRIPNGVDTERFRPARSREERAEFKRDLGLPPGPLVVYGGIIVPRKNVRLILEVFHAVHAAHPESHLVLVGPWPEGEEKDPAGFIGSLRRFVRENGLEGHVTFTGYRTDVDRYLRAGDVFFFPSKQEGMPNILLEAMACGLPGIVSRISGTEDLIRDGDDGFLVDPDSREGFASVLDRLLGDPSLRTRVGEKARRTILDRYALEFVAGRIRSLYAECLQMEGRRG